MTLRVLAFTPLPAAGAAGRYRVFQYVEPLRAHGITLEAVPFFDDAAFARLYTPGGALAKAWDIARLTRAHAARLRSAAHHDVAFVHRELWPLAGGWPLELLRAAQPRYVFDLDDAVFLPNVSDANRRFVNLKSHGSVSAIAAHAGAVTAGNGWLAEWARATRGTSASANTVEVLPTVVDCDLWRPASAPSGGAIRLLWIGSPSTVRYLEAWGAVITRLGARHPELELHVIGAHLELPGVRCVSHAWGADTERTLAQHCHIGLSPLDTGDWESGKCGLKQLLYMSLGLPAVASRTGVHTEIVTPGVDGELVDDDAGLEAALERLIVDRARREALGGGARATVEQRYSLRSATPRLAALLHRVAESR